MLQKSRLHGLLFILSMFLFIGLHAQKSTAGILYPYTGKTVKKKSYIDRAISVSPVTTINGEELREYKGQDVSTLVQSIPNTHIVRSAESTVTLRGLGTTRSLVLINGRRQPVYGQSVTYDANNIPVEAIERIEVLKDGAGAIYGADAVSGVINIITKKDMEGRVDQNNNYNSYYPQPTFNFNGYTNNDYSNWTTETLDIYKATPGQSTQPDNTYGIGGTVKMNLELKGDFRVQEFNYIDPGGNLREKTTFEWYPENYRFGETFYFDCNGIKLHYKSNLTDVNGYQFEWKEKEFKNDQETNSYRDIWTGEDGNPLRINLDPDINLSEIIKEWKNTITYAPPTGDCKTSANICDNNIFHIGISIVLEDFGYNETLTMPGAFAEYTRKTSQNFGVTGHIGYNFASKNNVDYSKLNFMAGFNYTPFKGANCDDNFTFTTQLLLGIVNQGQKYNGNKFSDSYFTGRLGAMGNFKIGKQTGVQLGAYFNPTFAENNTSKNFALSVGLNKTF
ncbi:MAG TPA: TonB-dependent receptor plug domain-containing protein [Chitinophagaceae bacterium]|nr:TonB-dependent receptor plug domain-containing protein [Chitinophagaceae bacterium]HPG12368.1 TonB-dependent receptor plug domain-containing protein [Chitinophagaceae bacterium]